MEYDLNGNRIYGEFEDSFGSKMSIKDATKNHVIVAGRAQVRMGGKGNARYLYPKRSEVEEIVAAFTAYLAATDGKGDLPEPDAPDGPAR